MIFFFDKKYKKRMKAIFGILSVIVILGMFAMYVGGLLLQGGVFDGLFSKNIPDGDIEFDIGEEADGDYTGDTAGDESELGNIDAESDAVKDRTLEE